MAPDSIEGISRHLTQHPGQVAAEASAWEMDKLASPGRVCAGSRVCSSGAVLRYASQQACTGADLRFGSFRFHRTSVSICFPYTAGVGTEESRLLRRALQDSH